MKPLFRLPALLLAAACASLLSSCRIEPPLRLPGCDDVEVHFNDIIIDLELVWGLDADWKAYWWYGWDDIDRAAWGDLDYPEPSSYELRLFYLGTASPDADYISYTAHHISEPRFRKMLDFGYHNVLAWSNIDSPDETQVLLVDESDPANVVATTSGSSLLLSSASRPVLNNPEIFYSAYEAGVKITSDPADYDYYLPDEDIWVKQIKALLAPRVYIYLVQLVLYNNDGRITGVEDACGITGLAASVNLQSGRTSYEEASVAFDMRLKRNLPARDGRPADILGGKLTTFGLCDMEPWLPGRAPLYEGSRTDLDNTLIVDLRFVNGTDKVFRYDITPQMRSQAHGGVITIEVDASQIEIPERPSDPNSPAGGFDPTVDPSDEEIHEFPI